MKTVKVNKAVLLERVEANRKQHEADYIEAFETWKIARRRELSKWLEDHQAGKDVPNHTTLVKPTEHLDDYDRAVDMIRMSVDDTIDIDEDSFSKYVRDEWDWKQNFSALNTFYKNAIDN